METRNEKQVAKRQEAGLPSDALFEADAKKGFENVDQESVALPILKLLQNGSAEAQRKHANYVEGADPGMFFNTVTRKLYDGEKGIQVIPCHYRLEYQEWADFGTGSDQKIYFLVIVIFFLKHQRMQWAKIDYQMVIIFKKRLSILSSYLMVNQLKRL